MAEALQTLRAANGVLEVYADHIEVHRVGVLSRLWQSDCSVPMTDIGTVYLVNGDMWLPGHLQILMRDPQRRPIVLVLNRAQDAQGVRDLIEDHLGQRDVLPVLREFAQR